MSSVDAENLIKIAIHKVQSETAQPDGRIQLQWSDALLSAE